MRSSNPHPAPPTRVASTLALSACVLSACLFGDAGSQESIRVQERTRLQDRLLGNLVGALISSADHVGRIIAESTDDLDLKIRSVVLRERFAEDALQTRWTDPPLLGLVDVWALSLQYEDYLEEAASDNDDVPPEAVNALNRAVKDIVTEMQDLLGDRFEQAEDAVSRFVEERPLQDGFVRVGVTHALIEDDERKSFFSWMPELNLNPFATVGAGLGESAIAIDQVGVAVDRFADIAAVLPLRISWQFEALHYRLEGDERLNAIAEGFKTAADATQTAAESIRTLPTDIRTQVVEALETLDPRLQEVRATLADVQDTSESLRPTAERFDAAAQSLDAMAAQLDVTLQTFQTTYQLLDGGPEEPEQQAGGESEARPFDVRDWESTGRQLTAMAAQLQETLRTFQDVIRDPELEARIQGTTSSAQETVSTVVWSVVIGALVLVAGVLGAALLYRRLTPRRP